MANSQILLILFSAKLTIRENKTLLFYFHFMYRYSSLDGSTMRLWMV